MPWNREDVLPFKVCYVDLPDFSILRTFASHQFRVSSRMITGCVVITHLLCLCAHSCVLVWTFKWNSIKVCHHHTPLCAGELTRCARETHLILECAIHGIWTLERGWLNAHKREIIISWSASSLFHSFCSIMLQNKLHYYVALFSLASVTQSPREFKSQNHINW